MTVPLWSHPTRPKAPPSPLADLSRGELQTFGDKRARQLLKDNGWGACSVPFGESASSSRFWHSASHSVEWDSSCEGNGRWHRAVRGRAGCGRRGVTGADPELVPRADVRLAASLGAGILRIAADGSRLRLYSVYRYGRPKDGINWTIRPDSATFDAAKSMRVVIHTAGVVVASGLDAAGNAFRWPSGSPLDTSREQLPTLNLVTDQHGTCPDSLREALQAAISPPTADAPTARRRTRAPAAG